MPEDLPKPGGPRPNTDPPVAFTALGLRAVDGDSSSELSGLMRFPLHILVLISAATEHGLDIVLLIRWSLGEFGEIGEISGKFRGTQWNSVGFCTALSMN